MQFRCQFFTDQLFYMSTIWDRNKMATQQRQQILKMRKTPLYYLQQYPESQRRPGVVQ